MKKFLIITSYLAVAIISGFVSVLSYNSLLEHKIIHDYEQFDLRERQLKLKYKEKKMAIDISETENELADQTNKVAHRKALNEIEQRKRQIELESQQTQQN